MQLWHHQQYTVDKFSKTQIGLDLSDPGTGKTSAHLAIYNSRPSAGRLLVVCPKTLMASAWGADIDRFFPHLTYSLATAENRFNAFAVDTDVVIINTDGVKDLTTKVTKAQRAQLLSEFDHLIIDENTSFKHASSARSKAMLNVSKYFQWRFGLSGTPTPISVTELWHPTLILDEGKRLGQSFHRFRNSMQVPTQVGPKANHLRWDDKENANDVTMHLLRDIVVRHEFESVMTDVPPNHVDRKFITLPNKLRKQYDVLERTCLLLIKEGKAVSPVHAAALRTKLLQLCSGAVYTDPDNYEVLDTFRYDLITDLVQERKHSVTFFVWKHQRDLLEKSFQSKEISYAVLDGDTPDSKRLQIVRDYQDGKYQTLLLHPKTGAHGLTLTRGTTSIVCSPIYEADILKQMIHRIYRGGQTEITNTLLVCAKDTVEELVYERLSDKKLRMDDFLKLVAELRG